MNDFELYKKNGYFIKNILSKEECSNIIKELNKIKTDMNIPHTNIQFGYGNIIDNDLSKIVTDNYFIKDFCKKLYGDNYYYNSLYVHNKHRWVGPDVEWHQEVFNIKTFHPDNKKYDLEDLKERFMQIYVALEDQNLENGCMKIIPYQDGVLKHYDTTNSHLNHKRAILPEELDRIYQECGIINLELKAGDILFFNHLLPHSSSSNNGPFDRKAMVFLTYKNADDLDEEIRKDEKLYRKNFALNYLKNIINIRENKEMYECGEKIKKSERTWTDIFEELPWYDNKFKDKYSIESLLAANGHTVSKTACYTLEKWEDTIKNIKDVIDYDNTNKNKIMEVGCGAGAILKYFEKDEIYGIEPSVAYFNIVSKALKGNFLLGDALKLEEQEDNKFDYIICYSTCQFFPDEEYFRKFIEICYKKLRIGGKLFIGDILDKDLEKEYISFRINQIGEEKYNKNYVETNLTHLYISRSKIKNLLDKFILRSINSVAKRGEENNFFRFNICLEKVNTRISNLLTNEETMEDLFTFKDFPVSLSCVDPDCEISKKLDMKFQICNKTGIIQIKDAPSLDDIYITPHNSSYGKVWHNLFERFAQKINNLFNSSSFNILEIGGGSLLLASLILDNINIKKYTAYEKNIVFSHTEDQRVNIKDEYFLKDTIIDEKYDVYIHSHVLEHVWNPVEFLEAISHNIAVGSYHCFIVPNLKETFSNKYTNALDFEHNFFIIEDYIDIILNNNNFTILEKEYYLDHSIIYITKKIEKKIEILEYPNLYDENKKIALNFKNYYDEEILRLNSLIDNFDGNLYLFGGTGFSIYLIVLGIKTDKVICILDNDPKKEDKKVYGTKFIVKNPKIIKDKDNVAVILKAASYQEEIETQLRELNPNVKILS